MSAPAWLHFVGLCTPNDATRLDALRKEARGMGCSIKWQRTGNKWTGKGGWSFGQVQIVRGGLVLAFEASVSMSGDAPSLYKVARFLDALEMHLAQIKSQDAEGKSDTPSG
jgi:hypothetical protein